MCETEVKKINEKIKALQDEYESNIDSSDIVLFMQQLEKLARLKKELTGKGIRWVIAIHED